MTEAAELHSNMQHTKTARSEIPVIFTITAIMHWNFGLIHKSIAVKEEGKADVLLANEKSGCRNSERCWPEAAIDDCGGEAETEATYKG